MDKDKDSVEKYNSSFTNKIAMFISIFMLLLPSLLTSHKICFNGKLKIYLYHIIRITSR